MADTSTLWTGIIATLFGGVGLKITDWWLSRNAKKTTDGAEIRQELRLQIESLTAEANRLRAEISAAEAQLDVWKQKFYDLTEKQGKTQVDLWTALAQLKEYADEDRIIIDKRTSEDAKTAQARGVEDAITKRLRGEVDGK